MTPIICIVILILTAIFGGVWAAVGLGILYFIILAVIVFFDEVEQKKRSHLERYFVDEKDLN
jgi:hypothetical protein